MIPFRVFAATAVIGFSFLTGAFGAEPGATASDFAPPETVAPSAPKDETATAAPVAPPTTPEAEAFRQVLTTLAVPTSDEERNEQAALRLFYEARGYVPVWLTDRGATTPKAELVISEIKRAGEWGLNAKDFPLPVGIEQRAGFIETTTRSALTPNALAATDIALSNTVLKYGRYARGGRIINPSEQLSSYLDRRPQFLKPKVILDTVSAAEKPDEALRHLHPAHPQFEKLRQKYLTLVTHSDRNADRHGDRDEDTDRARGWVGRRPEAKMLLANMEQWRWMPEDLGKLYVWNNIPEFMQRVVKNGAIVRKERIVAGELGKQTPMFSRTIRKITFKPTWIVPDSIKVRELWPSLLKGGGLMRKWALEVRTKDGKPLDWRQMNWSTADIREYDVIQPNGPQSVMGKVKFSFPNQHTVFMHDTLPRDKYMFRASRRTFSHGCMRVDKPIGLAEVLLREDKGWDNERVTEAYNTGPLNNEIKLDHWVPIHITYFTALVGDDGKLNTFPDVYGHERRIIQALDGKWDQIVKGRDHLAPVQLNLADSRRKKSIREEVSDLPEQRNFSRRRSSGGGLFDSIFGGN